MVKLFNRLQGDKMDSRYVERCIPVRIFIGLIIFFCHEILFLRVIMILASTTVSIVTAYKICRNFYLNKGETCTVRLCTANKVETGILFGGTVWWHKLRYIHVVTWVSVAAILLEDSSSKLPGIIALLDILPGLIKHYIKSRVENMPEELASGGISEATSEQAMYRF